MPSYLEYHFPFPHLAVSSSFFDQWRVGRARPLFYESLCFMSLGQYWLRCTIFHLFAVYFIP